MNENVRVDNFKWQKLGGNIELFCLVFLIGNEFLKLDGGAIKFDVYAFPVYDMCFALNNR